MVGSGGNAGFRVVVVVVIISPASTPIGRLNGDGSRAGKLGAHEGTPCAGTAGGTCATWTSAQQDAPQQQRARLTARGECHVDVMSGVVTEIVER